MDEQSQDAISRRNLRRSACDLCREYKVKCSGNRPKCDRCTRLGKECIFSVARPRPQDQDLRFGTRPGPKAHDRFIHVDPAMYRTTGSNSSGGNVDNISNNNNNGQQATKERSTGPSWRQNPDTYGEDARTGAFHGCWPDTLPPLHHHHLPAASIPSATAAPITRPPSQAASLTLDRDVDMAFQHAERASSSGQSEAHLSSVSDEGWYWNNVPDFSDNAYSGSSADIYRAVSDDFALLVSRGGIPPPHEEGHGGRDKSRQQQQQQQHAPAPGSAPTHALSVSALRSHSMMRRADNHNHNHNNNNNNSHHHNHHNQGSGAMTLSLAAGSRSSSSSSSAECSCVQQLTLSLFDLSTWKADQRPGAPAGGDSPTLSEYCMIYHNSMSLWERLIMGCVRCLSRPQFAQLLILNIEQLVHLQRNQQVLLQRPRPASSSSTTPPSPPPPTALSDVIRIGDYVVESETERAAIIGPLLKGRAAGLMDFIDSLRELLLPTGMPDLGARLDSMTDKLKQRGLECG
ncbi:Putative zn(2)Cys(6) fungal-type DNA-binding domain-containing protein [Colletotrichum destructivum]|uniref:Zn(2)Cys(6) fungal-type DNA-binding domain-containing protein n=1 Tax=Colletotrichum destructivum TaxID=34406 RepID=A0AAX4IT58_9PEZI|nr:Putative zn(2)Cys(6) fungal-type DNA-binding domain-containing protein [Colletotrichum destructivum]